ncbi:MAG: hypothetical protein ACAI38_17250 [Myxococcota bacterium]|nr:hypothetical protein [Myxococcota bacterium]
MRLWLLGLVLLSSGVAHAYTIESPVSNGCHERITEEALRHVRSLGLAEPIPARNDDEQALLDDMPFHLPGDMQDVASAAILLGVRRPDIRENASVDITSLALIHGDPSRQDDHCLRGPGDDEPNGSSSSVLACQVSARASLESAAAGLFEDGSVNADELAVVEQSLPLRSKVDLALIRFYLNMGQALHALQDGFSHTFRDEGAERITTVLNWVDYVEEIASEERDGPEHRSELDECVNIDARRQLRLERATNASVELLLAMLEGDPAARVDNASAAFERATQTDESCTFDNGWCATADSRYAAATTCAAAGLSPWLLLSALGFLGIRRGKKWDHSVKRSSSP